MNNPIHTLFGALLVSCVVACGQTGIRHAKITQETNLPRPSRILLYDFAVTEDEVKEYQGILRQQPSIKDPVQRERILAKNVAETLSIELVEGLRNLGFAVERPGRDIAPTGDELLIDGQFVDVDEGDGLRRLVIGFGSGVSKVDTQVQVYQGSERRKLLEFTTHSDSGKLPGAAATAGAGAAVSGGVTAGTVVGTAAVTGVKVYRSDVERMAAYSADQVTRYLSEFFVKQGWIRPDQVRKARIAY